VPLRGGQHTALDDPGEDGVARLFGAEAVVAAPVGDPLRLDDQLGGERRGADRADLPRADQVRQRAECLVEMVRQSGRCIW
jgi:hypothetical protein